MKVTRQESLVVFKPITVAITFETQEEVDAFYKCSFFDSSIPEHLCMEHDVNRYVAKMFANQLVSIRDCINT